MRLARFKAVLAVFLSLVMILSASVFAMANENDPPNPYYNKKTAEGGTHGDGGMEDFVDKKVFQVSVPVNGVSNDNLNFVLDPQKLLSSTDGLARGWNKNDIDSSATLFFLSQNSTAAKKYTNTSNPLSFNNLSSVSVDVAVTAKITGSTGITLSNDKAGFTADYTTPAMYMDVKYYTGNTGAMTEVSTNVVSDNTVSTNMLKAVPQDQDGGEGYVLSYNQAKKEYTYQLGENFVSGNQPGTRLNIVFSGASNEYADWYNLRSAQPKLEVTWNIKVHGAADETGDTDITVNSTTVAQAIQVRTAGIGESATVTKLEYRLEDTGEYANWRTDKISGFSDGVLTFVANAFSYVMERSGNKCRYRVTFSDGKTFDFLVHQ